MRNRPPHQITGAVRFRELSVLYTLPYSLPTRLLNIPARTLGETRS